MPVLLHEVACCCGSWEGCSCCEFRCWCGGSSRARCCMPGRLWQRQLLPTPAGGAALADNAALLCLPWIEQELRIVMLTAGNRKGRQQQQHSRPGFSNGLGVHTTNAHTHPIAHAPLLLRSVETTLACVLPAGPAAHLGVYSRTVCRFLPSKSCQLTALLILPDPWESSSPDGAVLRMDLVLLFVRRGGTASVKSAAGSPNEPLLLLFVSVAVLLLQLAPPCLPACWGLSCASIRDP